MRRDAARALAGIGSVIAVTAAYVRWLGISNATIVALTFLLVVLIVAATSRLWAAVTTSLVAMLCFNFFFMPPVGALTIADPQNWVALLAFVAVSLVAGNLSSVARAKTEEALARRDEVARLFDLSRDILLMTDSREAITMLARSIARRFELDYVAICLPNAGAWDISEAGTLSVAIGSGQLDLAFADVESVLEFDAETRTYSGHRELVIDGHPIRLLPLRLGTKATGLLASCGRPIDPGALDALAGVAAIAIERIQFLEERKTAELARQSEELKSALLASLGHDLRTPLTAIRVAASNLQASWLDQEERREQSDVVLAEVERLTRLFESILEMARIDVGAIAADRRWVDPAEIVEAALAQVEHIVGTHTLEVIVQPNRLVKLDPRLTAAALAHLVENAAQYSPADQPVELRAVTGSHGLELTVRDHGPGISPADFPRLFDRFYRGTESRRRVPGTGMGLAIARGLLAAEGGRVWAENCPDGGARFMIVVPAETRSNEAEEVPA